METLAQPSSPEEETDNASIRLYKPETETTERPAATPNPASGIPVLSPFTESLINDVRNGAGFGNVDTNDQYHILNEFGRDRELAAHEISAVRAEIQHALNRETDTAAPDVSPDKVA